MSKLAWCSWLAVLVGCGPRAARHHADAGRMDGGLADSAFMDAARVANVDSSTELDGERANADTGVAACHSLGNLTIATPPDPGRCDGNVAVNCAGIEGRWTTTVCGAGTTCEMFAVHVWQGDSAAMTFTPWFDSVGADCIPDGAPTCAFSLASRGAYVTDYVASCADDVQRECIHPAFEPAGVADRPAVAWTERGYVRETPCAADASCHDGVCRPDSWVSCDPSSFGGSCDGDRLTYCNSDHVETVACEVTDRCVVDCMGTARCIPRSAVACDPATFIDTCTSDTLTTCDGCYTEAEECGPQFMGAHSVDTVCGVTYDVYTGHPEVAQARCVFPGGVPCTPSSFTQRCDGATLVFCDGYVERSTCPAHTTCMTVGGIGGCAIAGAPLCSGLDSRCDGSLLETCCNASSPFISSVDGGYFCLPGHYGAITDCAGSHGTCQTFGIPHCGPS